MVPSPSIWRGVVWAHCLAVSLVLAFLTAKAFLEFNTDFDYLAYHLPDALHRFRLTSFTTNNYLLTVNEAFPPLPHLIEGFLVWISGSITAANGANALLFICAIGVLKGLGRAAFEFRWFAAATLAIPLVVLHFTSGNVDLAANLFLLLAFAGVFEIEILVAGKRSLDERERRTVVVSLWVAILGASAAVFSKYLAWPTAALLALALFLRILWLVRRRIISRPLAACLVLVLVLGTSSWPVRNLVLYQNPTSPIPFLLAPSMGKSFSGFLEENPEIPEIQRNRSHTTVFVYSVFELNRLHREASYYHWSPDQYASGASKSPHHRMGGWFFATVLVLGAYFLLSAFQGAVPRSFVLLFCLAVAGSSAIPQSHELRYSLYIPLVMAFIFARSRLRSGWWITLVLQAGVVVCALYVLYTVYPFSIDRRPPSEHAPMEARQFWTEAARDPKRNYRICGHMPMVIFWSGPTFREFDVTGC